MGCISSCFRRKRSDAEERSRLINKDLEKSRRQFQRTQKVLLLGAGECGKSTIVKQMKLIYTNGFTEAERTRFLGVIRENALRSITAIINAMPTLGIEYDNEVLVGSAEQVREYQMGYELGAEIPQKIVGTIIDLWRDAGVQACYRRSNEYQLLDNTKFFLEKIEEIAQNTYVVQQTDIVRARQQTMGIVEEDITIKTLRTEQTLKIIDVGGQRAQRKKWIHAFDGVSAIIWVAALSDYDLKLEEEERRGINRMKESLSLFQNTIHMLIFREKNIILFLNKMDVFSDKVPRSPIKEHFTNYEGGTDVDKALEFFRLQFREKNFSDHRQIYDHATCATDTMALKHLIDSVTDTILQSIFAEVGIV